MKKCFLILALWSVTGICRAVPIQELFPSGTLRTGEFLGPEFLRSGLILPEGGVEVFGAHRSQPARQRVSFGSQVQAGPIENLLPLNPSVSDGAVTGARLEPDGSTFYVGVSGGKATVWPAPNQPVDRSPPQLLPLMTSELYATSAAGIDAGLIDGLGASRGAIVSNAALGSRVLDGEFGIAMAVSSDGKWISGGRSIDSAPYVWHSETPQALDHALSSVVFEKPSPLTTIFFISENFVDPNLRAFGLGPFFTPQSEPPVQSGTGVWELETGKMTKVLPSTNVLDPVIFGDSVVVAMTVADSAGGEPVSYDVLTTLDSSQQIRATDFFGVSGDIRFVALVSNGSTLTAFGLDGDETANGERRYFVATAIAVPEPDALALMVVSAALMVTLRRCVA